MGKGEMALEMTYRYELGKHPNGELCHQPPGLALAIRRLDKSVHFFRQLPVLGYLGTPRQEDGDLDRQARLRRWLRRIRGRRQRRCIDRPIMAASAPGGGASLPVVVEPTTSTTSDRDGSSVHGGATGVDGEAPSVVLASPLGWLARTWAPDPDAAGTPAGPLLLGSTPGFHLGSSRALLRASQQWPSFWTSPGALRS